jgi:hypothetical protein
MNTLKTLTAAAALMLVAGVAHAQAEKQAQELKAQTQAARERDKASTFIVYNPQCIWQVERDYLNGISDIDAMEACHAVTPADIRSALGFLMEITDSNSFGPTPFKDAHCRPTYSGYACEYRGVAMQMSR